MVTVGTRPLVAKTCRACGCLKLARSFCFVRKGYRNSYCNDCKNGMAKPTVHNHQERAQKVAVRHRQPWSDQEVEKLMEMAEMGLSGPVMALALNRTLYSVYTMKNKLNKEI